MKAVRKPASSGTFMKSIYYMPREKSTVIPATLEKDKDLLMQAEITIVR